MWVGGDRLPGGPSASPCHQERSKYSISFKKPNSTAARQPALAVKFQIRLEFISLEGAIYPDGDSDFLSSNRALIKETSTLRHTILGHDPKRLVIQRSALSRCAHTFSITHGG